MPEPAKENRKEAPVSLSILAAVAVVAIILALLYVGTRLGTIEDQLEDQLSFSPPRAAPIPAADPASAGREIYVPAYSHIYSRGGTAFLLEVTLSVRNTDPELPIRVDRVRYFDTQGRKIREFAEAPIELGPLQTASYLIEKKDVEGGSGANFVVNWSAEGAVNPPIVEAVMVGVGKDHNLSFTSRGEPIDRTLP